PGRKLTPACISEVEKGQIGPDIEPASDDEVDQFMAVKIASAEDPTASWKNNPFSTVNISSVFRIIKEEELNLLSDEGQVVEFKSEFPHDTEAVVKIAKTIVAFANAQGGYIFFGISDAKNFIPEFSETMDQKMIDRINHVLYEYFAPEVVWSCQSVSFHGVRLPVAYVWESQRVPAICKKDRKRTLSEGRFYVRRRGANVAVLHGEVPTFLRQKIERLERRISDQYMGKAIDLIRGASRTGVTSSEMGAILQLDLGLSAEGE
ncbi:MAG: ATP-binding protein, partial [Pseudomonadota bacterium]